MQTFSTPAPVTVEIRNASGEVRVDLTDTEQTSVDVAVVSGAAMGWVDEIVRAFGARRADAAPDEERPPRWWEAPSGPDADSILERVRVELTRNDERGTLIVDTDPAARGWRSAFAVRVTAPIGSGVRVSSQSADVTVTGTADMLDIRTASGDVAAGDVTDAAQVHTASGDIRLQSVAGALQCRSASGDVNAGAIAGAVTVHSTSGDVRLQATGTDTEVRTVSGDVHVGDLTSGLVQLTAVSGDIDVGVHPGSLAAVTLSTISGNTRSDLTVTDGPDTDGPDADLPGIDRPEGVSPADPSPAPPSEPTLDIRARTTSGDIRLRRAVAV